MSERQKPNQQELLQEAHEIVDFRFRLLEVENYTGKIPEELYSDLPLIFHAESVVKKESRGCYCGACLTRIAAAANGVLWEILQITSYTEVEAQHRFIENCFSIERNGLKGKMFHGIEEWQNRDVPMPKNKD